MSKVHVTLFYDILSPYSYFAFETLTRYVPAWNLDLELRPVLLGGIQKILGTKMESLPAGTPLKRRNFANDLRRLSGEYQVRMTLPDTFPSKEHWTLNAIRFLRVLQDENEPKLLEACSRRLYVEFWGNCNAPTSPTFLDCLTKDNVIPSSKFASLLASSTSDENKARCVQDATDVVQKHGAFGLPWIIVRKPNGEEATFFGSDRMNSIAWWLGEGYEYTGAFPKERAAL